MSSRHAVQVERVREYEAQLVAAQRADLLSCAICLLHEPVVLEFHSFLKMPNEAFSDFSQYQRSLGCTLVPTRGEFVP